MSLKLKVIDLDPYPTLLQHLFVNPIRIACSVWKLRSPQYNLVTVKDINLIQLRNASYPVRHGICISVIRFFFIFYDMFDMFQ